MNDYQRSKVYRAEQSIRRQHPGQRFEQGAAVQTYVTKLQHQAWFRAAFPEATGIIKVRVNNRGRSWAYGGHGVIELPHRVKGAWAWTQIVVLHEVAHNVQPRSERLACDDVRVRDQHKRDLNMWGDCVGTHYWSCAAHGPEFATNFLTLVYREMGSEAGDALKAAYAAHKVKSHAAPDEVVPTPRRTVAVGEVIMDRVVRETGAHVTLTRAEGSQWVLYCHNHAEAFPMKGRLAAEAAVAHPSGWCPGCAALMV